MWHETTGYTVRRFSLAPLLITFTWHLGAYMITVDIWFHNCIILPPRLDYPTLGL